MNIFYKKNIKIKTQQYVILTRERNLYFEKLK